MSRQLNATVLAWIVLEALRGIGAIFMWGDPGYAWTPYVVTAATDLLTVFAVSFAAARSDWRGARLGLAVASVPFVVAMVNVVEGYFFIQIQDARYHVGSLALATAFMYGAAAPAWGRFFTPVAQGEANYRPLGGRGAWGSIWRFVLTDFVYVVVYFTGGFTILPLVKDFYASRAMPGPGMILLLQLFFRGPVFACVCILLVRMMGLPRWKGALAAAAVFSIVTGVAPLLVPTPYLPDAIRWVHLWEVSITNFAFALLAAALWGKPRAAIR